MDPKLIDWMAQRPRLAVPALIFGRLTWFASVLATVALLATALALGMLGVGGHDLAGRVSIGALTGFAALMMFSIGSLSRLVAGQLRDALTARFPEGLITSRRCASCF